jgi:outer membrane protein assembly factor BamB
VFFGNINGRMTALDAKSGGVVWRAETGMTISSPPSIRGNQLFFGNNANDIYSLDASTGETIWKIATGGFVVTSPAVGRDAVFVAGMDGVVRCVR